VSRVGRNVAEFIKAIPIWICYEIHLQNFHLLTYVWSGSLSLISWSAILGTILLIEKEFGRNVAYLFILVFGTYSITLTSYLDSTLDLAIFVSTAILVLASSKRRKASDLILFIFLSACATSIHEIMIPLIIFILAWMFFAQTRLSQDYLPRDQKQIIFWTKSITLLIAFLILIRHYLQNRTIYTTSGNAISPHFVKISSYLNYPKSIVLLSEATLLLILLSPVNRKYKNKKLRISLSITIFLLNASANLFVFDDLYGQYKNTRLPFLDYDYRSDFSILAIVLFVIVLVNELTGRKMLNRKINIKNNNVVIASLLLLIMSNSLTHVETDLKWNNCWHQNIAANIHSDYTTGVAIIGHCNAIGWTTFMTDLVFQDTSTPKSFLINDLDFKTQTTDPSFVQYRNNILTLPFGLNFPISSPGLNLAKLTESN
jgi:hypothetical protein